MHQRRALIDETFDSCKTLHYDLAIAPSSCGVSLALHDHQRGRFIAYIRYPFPIVDDSSWHSALMGCTVEYPWLRESFHSVRLGWQTSAYTVVPQTLFQPEDAKTLLEAMARVDSLDVIYFSRLADGVVMPFAIPGELINALTKVQPHFSIFPTEVPIARLAFTSLKRSPGLCILMGNHLYSLLLVNEGKLLAAIPLEAQDENVLLYRVLALLEAHGMAANEVPFFITSNGPTSSPSRDGESITTRAIANHLCRYMPQHDISTSILPYTFSYLLERIRENEMPLFSLMLCEL